MTEIPSPIERARNGDVAAFESLYREHTPRVYALCLRMTADIALAEELTQDTFVRAWENLDRYQGRAAFGSWLHRVAVNVVLGDRRSSMRRLGRDHEYGAAKGRLQLTQPDKVMDLERAIAGLPPKARQVFVLYDLEGYKHVEIAGLMAMTEGTSKAQLHRARRILREELA